MLLRACTPRRVEKGGLREFFLEKERRPPCISCFSSIFEAHVQVLQTYVLNVWRKRPSNCTFSHLRKDFLTNGVISTERKIDFARISAVSPFLAYVGVIMRTFFVVFPTPGGGGGGGDKKKSPTLRGFPPTKFFCPRAPPPPPQIVFSLSQIFLRRDRK